MDFSKLGEFGQSVQNFDKEAYKNEMVKSWEIESQAESNTPEMRENYRKLISKPELWDYVTDMNLKANITRILQELYGREQTGAIALGNDSYTTIKNNLNKNKSLRKFGSYLDAHDLDSTIIDAFAHIPFDQMRETLMTTAGLEFIPRENIEIGDNQQDIRISPEDRKTYIQPLYSINNGMSSKGYIDRIEQYYKNFPDYQGLKR
ncbi:MAG: hypothetical protein IJ772_00880 [Bacilli bacterium]|nr:hypothetical protein [Bacilli bacterium]MBR1817382.1 hypothetical protein [Bacilli bacterium]